MRVPIAGYRRTSLPQLIQSVVELAGSVTGRVLDVACGPGTYGRRVASPARKVYGIDISRGMLEQGLAYSRREGVTDISFARAKVEALPFADAVFDAALCCGSLHLFPDTVGALREIGRAMRPGARLIVLTFTAGDAGILRFRWLRERYRRSGRLRIFEIPALEQDLRQAGFENFRPATTGSLLTFTAQKRPA